MQKAGMRTLAAIAVLAAAPSLALAQGKEVKIGVIFDYTGPFAAGGSVAAATGTKIAIDMINERGGVEGYSPSTPMPSPRPRWRSARRRACSTRRRST